MKVIFKVVESEIPKGKIKSISFPDLSKEERIRNYGSDRIPIFIETKYETRMILCGKTLVIENEG